jgi:uncharacterized membrane protein
MIEIIPNWHPIFTHFTIGLLLTGTALFLAGHIFRSSDIGVRLTTVARWNLGIGAGFAVITVLTGYQAYYSVGHDADSHAAMTIHLKWAWVAFALFGTASVLAWRDRKRRAGAAIPLSIILLAAASALAVTGYLGGENVYRHGIGVMRLPESSGPGHDHAHDDGEAHSQAAAGNGMPAGSNNHEPIGSGSGHAHAQPATPEDALDAFHHALEEGNGSIALEWLADDAVILEGGVAQSKDEYASHHLGSDMAFLRAMQSKRLSREIREANGVVTIITRTQLAGTYQERSLDIVSSETAVLTQTETGWRIQHLHWSN